MNSAINIRKDDIFWKFYCKRFTIEGKEVEPPTSICPYFWTALHGFNLWLRHEVRLSRLWFLTLSLLAVLAVTRSTVKESVSEIFFAIGFAVFSAIYLITMFVSLVRAMRIIDERAPWMKYVIASGVVVFLVAKGIVEQSLWSWVKLFFTDIYTAAGHVPIVAGVLAALGLIVFLIGQRRRDAVWRASQVVGAYMVAKKNRICPPVNPPEELKAKK